jgi:hypothetical protein
MDPKREVKSLISFINFYCWFIPGFSHHAHTDALFDLTMKDVRLNWGLPQEASFMKLRELVILAPVLVLPDNDLSFRLEADSSGIATRTDSPSSRVMRVPGTLSHSCQRCTILSNGTMRSTTQRY